jgi:GNAT superfamily N-acetyltransferase
MQTLLDSDDGWRPLDEADMDTVAAIAGRLHPTLPERTAVLAEKRRLFPAGCRKWLIGGRMCGYALAHPWLAGEPPTLDAFLQQLPAAADCLFLHDVAVLPEARGRGAAERLLAHAEAAARQHALPALALIAAYGTARLWGRFGFVAEESESIAGKLAGYGREARYLIRPLLGPGEAAVSGSRRG